MKVLILCGGKGLRIKDSFENTPKPLISIHGKPLLRYIIEIYKKHEINNFILLVGDNGSEFIDFADSYKEANITILQTGKDTPTGGRILRAKKLLNNEPFFLTYGDGVSDIDITSLLSFHLNHKLTASLTAVKPVLPFGLLNIDDQNLITSFDEKPILDQYVNGGFFILNPSIFDILDDNSDFENEILPMLSENRQLCAFLHNGFWKNMDTYKDFKILESISFNKIL